MLLLCQPLQRTVIGTIPHPISHVCCLGRGFKRLYIGVRDLVARGYFIPGRTSQRGGGRAPAFRVARCRTSSGVRVDWLGWVPLGPKRARQGPAWSRMGPHISRTPMRDSRVIRQGSSGPVGPYRVPMGFRPNPDLARRDLMGLDGSPDCPASVHN